MHYVPGHFCVKIFHENLKHACKSSFQPVIIDLKQYNLRIPDLQFLEYQFDMCQISVNHTFVTFWAKRNKSVIKRYNIWNIA